MFAAFTIWQMTALSHLVFIEHTFGTYGIICEVDSRTGQQVPEDWGPKPLSSECPILAQVTSADTQTSLDFVIVIEDQVLILFHFNNIEDTFVTGEEIFMISPSNSPPCIS